MRDVSIPVTTHGRLLIEEGVSTSPLRLLVGCHGYAQNADEMMEMLRSVPAGAAWTRLSIQALHRFYRGRSGITVASWMTRQDREAQIADNLAYVNAAIAEAAGGRAIATLAFCGFSQGTAMAFRAGALGAHRADAVLALGGDVPPELLDDPAVAFPRVLLARGARDEWFGEARLRGDEARLLERGAKVETLTFDGGHEWHADFATRAARILDSWFAAKA
jgi:predicted esterase